MKNLSGMVFGRLTAIIRVAPFQDTKGRKVQRWLCKCECGNFCIIRHGNLTSGTSTSCGCVKREATSLRRIVDLTGQTFGELTVLKRASNIGGKRVLWLCKCSCGHHAIVSGGNLKSGNTTSCGCLKNSLSESIIVSVLKQYNILYQKEVKFKNLLSQKGNPLRFDFMIYTQESFFLLEYQGIQHFDASHKDFGRYEREYSDKAKKDYCLSNSIELVEIKYNEDLIEALTDILRKHNLLHDNSVPSAEVPAKV